MGKKSVNIDKLGVNIGKLGGEYCQDRVNIDKIG